MLSPRDGAFKAQRPVGGSVAPVAGLEPSPSPSRYLALLTSGALLGLGAVAATNAAVDPYALLGPGTSEVAKPATEGHDRMAKVFLLARERPDTLLLGTSRALVMLDPASPALAGRRAVNAAVNAGQPLDALRTFQHARAFLTPRLVIVGLDLLAFDLGARPNAEFADARFAVSRDGVPRPAWFLHDVPAAFLSWEALRASLGTLRRRDRPSYLTPLGQRTAASLEVEVARYGTAQTYNELSERHYLELYACADPLRPRHGPGGRPGVADPWADLTQLVHEARGAGARVVLYFSPQHPRHAEVVRQAGLEPAWWEWRARLAELARARGAELYDFSTLALDEDDAWWDSAHARAAVGERVLAAVMAGAERVDPPGALAVADAAAAGALDRWRSAHAEEVQLIQGFAAEILPRARALRGCAQTPGPGM